MASLGSALMRMALSAPIANALRMVGSESARPTLMTRSLQSLRARASLISNARVSASSSQGLMIH